MLTAEKVKTLKNEQETDNELENDSDFRSTIEALHEQCTLILKQCQSWKEKKSIKNLQRYTNLLTDEMHYLKKLVDNPGLITKDYVDGTRLKYLEAVFKALIQVGEKCNEVMNIFSGPTQDNDEWMPRADMDRKRSVKVDIVAENSLVWIKIIACNGKMFRHEFMELGWEDSASSDESESESEEIDYDSLPIIKKAREYLKTAKVHHVHFNTPLVVFAFMRIKETDDPFTMRIMDKLREIGIIVHLHDPEHDTTVRESYMSTLLKWNINLDYIAAPSINIDISSVLVILSELTHHACLPEDISSMPLKLQADREKLTPALHQLKPYICGDKKLFVIQSAFDRLNKIVPTVGGHNEVARFNYLFRHHFGHPDMTFDPILWTILPSLSIEIIPDAPSNQFTKLLEPPSKKSKKSKLNNGRKIRSKFTELHAQIFGSGDHYRMTTLTSIQWMEEALKEAGLQGSFIVCHEPRSLVEQKLTNRKQMHHMST